VGVFVQRQREMAMVGLCPTDALKPRLSLILVSVCGQPIAYGRGPDISHPRILTLSFGSTSSLQQEDGFTKQTSAYIPEQPSWHNARDVVADDPVTHRHGDCWAPTCGRQTAPLESIAPSWCRRLAWSCGIALSGG